MTIFLIISFSMKKYQLWLERKTYSQHLNNLMRIKLQSTQTKFANKLAHSTPRSIAKQQQPSITKDASTFFLSSRDLSYIITARELQKHKLRLVRSNEIVRENQQLVKRLNKIKPFVSNTRPLDHTSYKLNRKMRRSNQEQNSSLKDQNYKQFQKQYTQNAKINHKYQLTITVQELDQRIHVHPSTELALQVLSPHSIAKSEFISPSSLIGHTFQFTFPEKLGEKITLRFHQLKGLEHSILSEFEIDTPKEGQITHYQETSKNRIAFLNLIASFKRIKPKFWSVKLFRV